MKSSVAILAISFVVFGCKPKRKSETAENAVDTVKIDVLHKDTVVQRKPVEIKYYAIKNKDSIAQIASLFNDTQLKIILAVNRIDLSKLYGAEMLAIPDTFLSDLRYYSPFPNSVQLLDSVKKILLISYPAQAVGVYENGKLVRWSPASMGKQSTPTPTGLLHTNWKSKQTVSTDDSSWILKWYFNLDNFRGVSLHQYELPGHPASHACIRLYPEDAEWLYYWAEQWKLDSTQIHTLAYGTPVIIFGSYDFDQSPPWYKLAINPKELSVPDDTLSAEINRFLPTILKRQLIRDSVVSYLESELLPPQN